MIYKLNDVRRLACSMLVKDIQVNPNFYFTNSSYGVNGECLGTVVYSKDTKKGTEEHLIQYTLELESFTSKEYVLWKHTEDIFHGYSKEDGYKHTKDTPIMKLYEVSSKVFSDDKLEAFRIEQLKNKRMKNRPYKVSNYKYITVNKGTKLYDPLYEFLVKSTSKRIKYGNPITCKLDIYNSKEFKGTTLVVSIEYRGSSLNITKYHKFY